MTKRMAIVALLIVVMAVAAVVTFAFLPKSYRIGERLGTTTVFWNDNEAFFLLGISTQGRAGNILQDKLSHTHYGYLTLLLGGDSLRMTQQTVVYHLLSTGILDRIELPPGSGSSGTWAMRDGALHFTPYGSGSIPSNSALRWDGQKFVTLPPEAPGRTVTNLSDADDEDDDGTAAADAQELKKSGWHHKALAGVRSDGGESAWAIKLGQHTLLLTQQNFNPVQDLGNVDYLSRLNIGAKSLEISGSPMAQAKILWQQNGWKEVSKSEYERIPSFGRGGGPGKASWAWLVVIFALIFWRFWHWINLVLKVATMKSRTLNVMPTAYSLPPATPGQFQLLDSAKLDRCTRDLEILGFTQMLDYSLVGNASKATTPNFCRALVHTGNHCFAVVYQIFQPGKLAMPMKCEIQGWLQDGWDIDVSDGKPLAASSLLRSAKGIRINLTQASPSELLHEFLKMRDQVCMDMGIAPERQDTLEAFIAHKQRAADNSRSTLKEKQFAIGLAQVFLRRFSLMRTEQEYRWLGDYPKEAERRRNGYAAPGKAEGQWQ